MLYRPVRAPNTVRKDNVTVRITGPEEAALWSEISTRGWSHEHPEFAGFLRELGVISTAREHCPCFLGEVDGRPGGAADTFDP